MIHWNIYQPCSDYVKICFSSETGTTIKTFIQPPEDDNITDEREAAEYIPHQQDYHTLVIQQRLDWTWEDVCLIGMCAD